MHLIICSCTKCLPLQGALPANVSWLAHGVGRLLTARFARHMVLTCADVCLLSALREAGCCEQEPGFTPFSAGERNGLLSCGSQCIPFWVLQQ